MFSPNLLRIDKPAGWTSHDVVAKIRGLKKTKAVGHAGTLDPFATGLLILGIGPGTKELTDLVGLDKTYETTLTLGATSTTFDPEGEITQGVDAAFASANITLETIEDVLNQFRGGYAQKAPLHSAKKTCRKKIIRTCKSRHRHRRYASNKRGTYR
jgi:tRNA pseudouridine55 synthase